uniref:CCHC-type domain-containing protein n=1 Tax=Gouania willdenowi TaxID=441366 RepID=A0A8C5E7U6_GOUWI
MRDEDGIRTGARRFYVRLKREANSELLHHLPSTIQLGQLRGPVFYAGQPKTCRKCGCSSHLVVNCDATYCRNCKSSAHNTKDCNQPMKCNLCGSDAHTFRKCPESYANKTRQMQGKLQRYYLMLLSGFDVNEDILKLKKTCLTCLMRKVEGCSQEVEYNTWRRMKSVPPTF